MKRVIKKAHGKINLFLSVGALRADKKHEVETVLHKTGIFDTLTVTETACGKITVTSDLPELSCGSDNLVYRACDEYGRRSGIDVSVSVDIQKKIPIAGGMGGGSSDCAATLIALNDIYGAFGFDELNEIAASLGTDIPFFMYDSRAMIGVGTGEIMRPCAAISAELYGLFVFGGHKESTGAMYARLDEKKREKDMSAEVLSSDAICRALEKGDIYGVLSEIRNDFEICSEGFPEKKEELLALGADKVLLCGSGPTVCGLFLDKSRAEKALTKVRKKAFLTEIA